MKFPSSFNGDQSQKKKSFFRKFNLFNSAQKQN